MPELSQKERLQLSLLDRLTDDEPEKKSEQRDKRVISVARLKELVLRDLGWLLNSVAAEASMDLKAYKEVQSSTLNFGIPDLSGLVASSLNPLALEREIVKCIKQYEPRIIASSLLVKVIFQREEMSGNTLSFEINADLWAQPIPLQLFLQTEVDIDNGHVAVKQWR